MKPKLSMSLLQKDAGFKEVMEKLKLKTDHPFLKRYSALGVKEGFFSDMSGALGRMHDTMVDAAWPEMIGRSIINVMPTNEAMERFPIDTGAVAYEYAEGTVTRLSGKKATTVDINANILAESSDEWTREYLEDASWNVMDRATQNIGNALGVKEAEKILALYTAVLAADLATGADLAGGGTVMSWTKLLSLWHAVKSEKRRATVIALNDMQVAQLLNDSTFTNAQSLPAAQTDLEAGVVSGALGMKIVSSPLVTNGVAFAIDTRVASAMLLRRDVTVEDWEDVKNGKYGVRATTRFGLGVLDSKGIARMTNIKTTIT
ncbi:MAG: phage major capsid protein [Candidatus Bathyarchaeota archaeon]|nr:phage major capsid protein [Candidatus Bathyarchaeota archaeon]